MVECIKTNLFYVLLCCVCRGPRKDGTMIYITVALDLIYHCYKYMTVKVVHLAVQHRTFWPTCTRTWSVTTRGHARHTASTVSWWTLLVNQVEHRPSHRVAMPPTNTRAPNMACNLLRIITEMLKTMAGYITDIPPAMYLLVVMTIKSVRV